MKILQLWGSICTSKLAPSVAFGRRDGQNHDFWPKSLPKKARPGTGKQHGLASSRTPFFDLRWNEDQCQVASRTYKKRGFCSCGAQFAPPIAFEMHRWRLPLRLGVTSDPKAFPKRIAPERGNSMAWRAQGHRFSTSVRMIFNVKRCVQNL